MKKLIYGKGREQKLIKTVKYKHLELGFDDIAHAMIMLGTSSAKTFAGMAKLASDKCEICGECHD